MFSDDKVIRERWSKGRQDSGARFAGGGRRSRTHCGPTKKQERERESGSSCFLGFLLVFFLVQKPFMDKIKHCPFDSSAGLLVPLANFFLCVSLKAF